MRMVYPVLCTAGCCVTVITLFIEKVGVVCPNLEWLDPPTLPVVAPLYGGRLLPRPQCVRWEPSSPPKKRGTVPNFWSTSVVAKWLDGSRCHLVWSSGHVGDPAPSPHRGTAPNFWSMSVVAKWSPISAIAEHLYEPSTVVNCYKKLFIICYCFFAYFYQFLDDSDQLGDNPKKRRLGMYVLYCCFDAFRLKFGRVV